MKKKNFLKKMILGASSLAVVVVLAGANNTFAQENIKQNDWFNFEQKGFAFGKNGFLGHLERIQKMEERLEQKKLVLQKQKEVINKVISAIEKNDFEAFKIAMKDYPNAEKFLTKENFEILRKAHELQKTGNFEEAKKLLKDSNLFGFQKQMPKNIKMKMKNSFSRGMNGR